jgi:hypothetical protein
LEVHRSQTADLVAYPNGQSELHLRPDTGLVPFER